jgi:hypothetical protein
MVPTSYATAAAQLAKQAEPSVLNMRHFGCKMAKEMLEVQGILQECFGTLVGFGLMIALALAVVTNLMPWVQLALWLVIYPLGVVAWVCIIVVLSYVDCSRLCTPMCDDVNRIGNQTVALWCKALTHFMTLAGIICLIMMVHSFGSLD